MIKTIKDIIFIVAVAVIMVSLLSCKLRQGPKQACFGSSCFNLELAITPEQRNQGLMFREELAPDDGMLFIFEEEDRHCFWMKNTLIALDMIWLDTKKEVVHIAKSVPPCKTKTCPSFCPDKKAKYVLEVNAGTCDSLRLRVGDSLLFD